MYFLQESIEYCQQCLEKIHQVNGVTHPNVVVLENHFEPTFKPHLEGPTKVQCMYMYTCT